MHANGHQEATQRRLDARWQFEGGTLGDYEAWRRKHDEGLDAMHQYKQRLVAEKLADVDFRRGLEVVRAELGERPAPPLPPGECPPEEWAAYVAATDAYNERLDALAGSFREKYSLNAAWLSWLIHYIETGQSEPKRLRLYSLVSRKDAFGGSYMQLQLYFPLSKQMFQEVIYWLEFTQPEAFGAHYRQTDAGGRPRGVSERTAQRYRRLARWFQGSACRSEREFCDELGIPRATLSRALRFVSKYGVDPD